MLLNSNLSKHGQGGACISCLNNQRKTGHFRLNKPAFTVLETVVCLAILSILSMITVYSVQKVRGYTAMGNEVSAGKSVISAYQLFAADNGGKLMPGLNRTYWSIPFKDRTVSFAEAPHRYPYRLAPYLDYNLEGAIFVNGNREQIIDQFGRSGGMYDYGVSLMPALGMNMFFVGGIIDQSGNLHLEQARDVITRQNQVEANIIVFASGGYRSVGMGQDDKEGLGYHEIKAPYTWTYGSWSEHSIPSDYGNVSARHDGKAVCVFLDGSTQVLSIEELRDMRLWSTQAALADNPNYRPEAL